MSTDINRLISRLEGVKPAGEGRWYAKCPAHADKSPSLSIRDTGEKVLIHCFTGCDAEDVLTAVGLSWRDLYSDRWEAARHASNPGARKYAKRVIAAADPLEHERRILDVAAADLRAGKTFSIEDQARIELAIERIEAQEGAR